MVDDSLANKDPEDLSVEEAAELARQRSNASLEDYNPAALDPAERVVEMPDRGSAFVKDLVDHPDPVIAADAASVVEGNYPGGPHYPNGPEGAQEGNNARTQKTVDAVEAQREAQQAEAERRSTFTTNDPNTALADNEK